jgi:peptidoglycan/xylan/chitin deacetylase (PgdA/CDA1 family)
MRTFLRDAVLRTAHGSGLTGLVAGSGWRQQRLLILCYHWLSFQDEHEQDPTYLTPEFFRRRLQRLRDGRYNVLKLSDALARLRDGTLPPRSVAITFDDGTRDFAELAVPLLRQYSMPATVYVTTYYCEHLLPVFDIALKYLLWRTGADASVVRAAIGTDVDVPGDAGVEGSWRIIYDHAKRLGWNAAEKHEVLRRVASAGGVDFDAFLASGMFQQMTPQQIRELPRHLIDVELHTHRHRTPRERGLFVRELRDNRECLERYLDRRDFSHFCYPSGDYWGEFLPWMHDEQIASATTCVPGLASRADHPLLLPRFLDSMGISDALFDTWTSGLAELLPRRRQHQADGRRLVVPPPQPSSVQMLEAVSTA